MLYVVRGLENAQMKVVQSDKSDFLTLVNAKVIQTQERFKSDLMTLKNGQEVSIAKGRLCYYFISGDILNGYRTLKNMKNRRLLALDYDDITTPTTDFIASVAEVLEEYSYFLFPSTSYSVERPKFRLVIDSERDMNEREYKATMQDVASKIPSKIDDKSFGFVQIMGMPITSNLEEFQSLTVVNHGIPYPVIAVEETKRKDIDFKINSPYISSGYKGRVIQLLEEVVQGIGEGGRNNFFTKAFGTLITAQTDPALAIRICMDWNEMYCTPPLTNTELIGVFNSIHERERKKVNHD